MASLYSLPEHLVGILYSLMDPLTQRAFFSCSNAVRRAPSVLSQITSLCISSEDLVCCHPTNPLACLPAGVSLKTLTVYLDYNGFLPLADLLLPSQEDTRVRVQNTIGNLESLELIHLPGYIEDEGQPNPLKDPYASGSCMRNLPLRDLLLHNLLPSDVITLLEAMSSSEGLVTRTLSSLVHYHQLDECIRIDQDSSNAIVARAACFKHLSHISLDCPATDYGPLTLLPALRELRSAQIVGNLYDVLPRMPQLEVLYMPTLFSKHQGPPLRSESLKELHVRSECDLDTLEAVLDCACQGLLPGLESISLWRMSVMHENSDTARETGIALAARLQHLPQLSVAVLSISYVLNFDAFLEACLLTPGLWRKTECIHVHVSHAQATRLRELPNVFPDLKRFTIMDCSPDEVLALCDTLGNLRKMSYTEVDLFAEEWSPGIATSVLSLCVRAGLAAHQPRATVALRVHFRDGEVSETDAGRIRAEISVLQKSWATAKAMLDDKVHLVVSQTG